jgi:hypothetical protein
MYMLLMRQSELDSDDAALGPYGKMALWVRCCPDIPCVKLLRYKIIYEHGDDARRSLVDYAFSGCEYFHHPDMVLAMLGYGDVVDQLATLQDARGRTALHLATAQMPDCLVSTDPIIGASWFEFASKLVLLGADLHRQDNEGMSPLISLFEHMFSSDADFGEVVRRWIKCLEAVGVDLSAYGKMEKVIWNEWKPFHTGPKVANWTYGPKPEDWTVEIGRCLPIYRLDIPPGAWPEYEDKILWHPDEEDLVSTPWKWRRAGVVSIRPGKSDVDEDGNTSSKISMPVRCLGALRNSSHSFQASRLPGPQLLVHLAGHRRTDSRMSGKHTTTSSTAVARKPTAAPQRTVAVRPNQRASAPTTVQVANAVLQTPSTLQYTAIVPKQLENPLFVACRAEDAILTAALLRAGANIQATTSTDVGNELLLFHAVRFGQIEVAEALLQFGQVPIDQRCDIVHQGWRYSTSV